MLRRFAVLSMLIMVIFTSINMEAIAGPIPSIDTVSVGQSNESGTFVFNLYINGSTSGDVTAMNISFMFENGTDEMRSPWIDPVNLIIFGNGISFVGAGPSGDRFASWRFRFALSYDLDAGPGLLVPLFEGMLGFNLSDIDPASIDPGDVDAENATVSVVVRAFNATGAYDEVSEDITEELLLAFYREAPDDVQPPVEEGSDGEDLTLPLIVLSLGMVLVVGALLLWFFYRKKDKGQKGLGYSHERF